MLVLSATATRTITAAATTPAAATTAATVRCAPPARQCIPPQLQRERPCALYGRTSPAAAHGASSFRGLTVVAAADSATTTVADDAEAKAPSSATMAPLSWPQRSVYCGRVSETHVGQSISLCGWVDRRRDLGGVCFVDLRDHTGVVQVKRRSS